MSLTPFYSVNLWRLFSTPAPPDQSIIIAWQLLSSDNNQSHRDRSGFHPAGPCATSQWGNLLGDAATHDTPSDRQTDRQERGGSLLLLLLLLAACLCLCPYPYPWLGTGVSPTPPGRYRATRLHLLRGSAGVRVPRRGSTPVQQRPVHLRYLGAPGRKRA